MSDAGFISSVVFWIGANALIGYAIDKSKNDILGCVLLSVLLGPIGWLIALATKGELRKSPFCAEQIKPEAKVCRYCGREVTPTVALKPAVPSVPKTKFSVLASDIVILIVVALVVLMLWYARR
jgi:hypothetical protein